MRRAAPALAALTLAVALAALAVGNVRAQDDGCPRLDLTDLRFSLADFDAVVVGAVAERAGGVAILPEFWLKGAASAGAIPLAVGDGRDCPLAPLPPAGTRALAALRREGTGYAPPPASALFVIADGVAVSGASPPARLPEAELVARIRAVTGQYAVPAAAPAEGASLDWVRVVAPVAGAILAIFAVSLLLMRLWHRIDPT